VPHKDEKFLDKLSFSGITLFLLLSYCIVIVIQFNSILYYLCAESTAKRPITDTAQRRYKNINSNTVIRIISKVKQCSNNDDDDDDDNNNNNNNNNSRPKQSTDLIIIKTK
jgi:hypothetical protein